MDYRDYQHLTFERREHGVVLVTINRPEVLNATNDRLHWELTQVWLTLDADETARVAVVTGAGTRAFSAGGDLEMVEANSRDPRGVGPGLQHDQHRQADHLGDQRRRRRSRPRGGAPRRHLGDVGDRALHRRPHEARRGGG